MGRAGKGQPALGQGLGMVGQRAVTAALENGQIWAAGRNQGLASWSTKEGVRAPCTSSDGVERFAAVTVALGCFSLKQPK